MNTRLLAGLIGAGLLAAPMVSAAANKNKGMSADMRRAIAWERHKDQAAARQARIEARRPSVSYSNANRSANRNADESVPGRTVKDPGPPAYQRDKDKKDKQ